MRDGIIKNINRKSQLVQAIVLINIYTFMLGLLPIVPLIPSNRAEASTPTTSAPMAIPAAAAAPLMAYPLTPETTPDRGQLTLESSIFEVSPTLKSSKFFDRYLDEEATKKKGEEVYKTRQVDVGTDPYVILLSWAKFTLIQVINMTRGHLNYGEDFFGDKGTLARASLQPMVTNLKKTAFTVDKFPDMNERFNSLLKPQDAETKIPISRSPVQRNEMLIDMMIQALQIWAIDREILLSKGDGTLQSGQDTTPAHPELENDLRQLQSMLMLDGSYRILASPTSLDDLGDDDFARFRANVNPSSLRGILKLVQGFREPSRRKFEVPFLYEILVALAMYYFLEVSEDAKGVINLQSTRFSPTDEYNARDLLYQIQIPELRAHLMEKKLRIRANQDATAVQEHGVIAAVEILHEAAWHNTLRLLKTAILFLSRRSKLGSWEQRFAMAKIWPLDQELADSELSIEDAAEPENPEKLWQHYIDVVPLFQSPELQKQVENEMGISVASQQANLPYFMDYHRQYYKSISNRQKSIQQLLYKSIPGQAFLMIIAPCGWVFGMLTVANAVFTSESIALNYFANQGAIPGLYSALFYNFASFEIFELPPDLVEQRTLNVVESLGDWKLLVGIIGAEAAAAFILFYVAKARRLKRDQFKLREDVIDENLSTIRGFRTTYNEAFSPIAYINSSPFRRAYVEGRFAMFQDLLAEFKGLSFADNRAALTEWLTGFRAKFPKHYSFYKSQWSDLVRDAKKAGQPYPELDEYVDDVLRNRNGCTLNGNEEPYYCFSEIEANSIPKPWRAQNGRDITGTVLRDQDAAAAGWRRYWDAIVDTTRVDARFYGKWGSFIKDNHFTHLLDDATTLRQSLTLASAANGETTAFGAFYSRYRARREMAHLFDSANIGVKNQGMVAAIRNAFGNRADVVGFSRLAAARNYDEAGVRSLITKLDDGQNLELWGFGGNSRRGRYPVQVMIRGAHALAGRLPGGAGMSVRDRWGNYLLTHHLEFERLGIARERVMEFKLVKVPADLFMRYPGRMMGRGIDGLGKLLTGHPSDGRALLSKLSIGVAGFGTLAQYDSRKDKFMEEIDQVLIDQMASVAKVFYFTGLERGGFSLGASLMQSARVGGAISLGSSLVLNLRKVDDQTFSEEAYGIYSRTCADMLYCGTFSLAKGFTFEAARDMTVGIGGKRNPWMLLPFGLIEFGNKYTGSRVWSELTRTDKGFIDEAFTAAARKATGDEEVVIAIRANGAMQNWDRFAGYPVWSKVVLVAPNTDPNSLTSGEQQIQALLNSLDDSLPQQVADLELPIDGSAPVIDINNIQGEFAGIDFFDDPNSVAVLNAAVDLPNTSPETKLELPSLQEIIAEAQAMTPGSVLVGDHTIPVVRYRYANNPIESTPIAEDWQEFFPFLKNTRLFRTAVTRLIEIYNVEGTLDRIYVMGKNSNSEEQELLAFGWGAMQLPHKVERLYIEDISKEAVVLGRNARKADVVARLYLESDEDNVPAPLLSGQTIPAKENLSLHYVAYQQCLQQGARPSKLDRATKIRLNYMPFPAGFANRAATDWYFDSFEIIGDRAEDEVLVRVDWDSEFITPCDANWRG